LFFEIALTKVEYDAYDDEQSWLEQYGLIKNLDDNAVVSNPIYKKLFCSSKEIQQNNIVKSKPKPLIFLCYAREDVKRVEVVYERLKRANFNPWMDTRNILPGQNWDYEIKQAMKKANFALVFISSLSNEKRGYINKEIKWALDRQSEKLNGDIFLIPVQIESCDLPENLSNFQAVNLELEEFEQIMISLNFQIKKQGFDTEPAITIITNEIQNLLDEIDLLKDDVDRELKIKKVPAQEIELVKSDIEVAEKALLAIEISHKQGQKSANKPKNQLKRFIKNISKEKSSIYHALKLLRDGEEYRDHMIEIYNKIEAHL